MSVKIGIILATYNGERYLWDQLLSITKQIGVDWHLYASDDGSHDKTMDILRTFQRQNPNRVTLLVGPGNGVGQNFLSALKTIQTLPDYIAFCDQDDVWLPDKLLRAVQAEMPLLRPALYCSAQTVCDAHLKPYSPMKLHRKKHSFGNALVQNIVAGNTLVINKPAANLLQKTYIDTVASHDWWAYLLITAVGGHVIYDPKPRILYRQHADNVIGARQGTKAVKSRLQRLVSGEQAMLMQQKTMALLQCPHLTYTAKKQLDVWLNIHKIAPYERPWILKAAGIEWQTPLEQLIFDISLRMGYFNPPMVHETLHATCKAA